MKHRRKKPLKLEGALLRLSCLVLRGGRVRPLDRLLFVRAFTSERSLSDG